MFMATIVCDCPHCGTAKSQFIIFGSRNFPVETAQEESRSAHTGAIIYELNYSCAGMCSTCYKPLAILLVATHPNQVQQFTATTNLKLVQENSDVKTIGLSVVETFPKPPVPEIPTHLPETIERAFMQAERNFHISGNEEASALMYRRSLELAIKDRFPDLKGSVAARTKQLVDNKELPSSMGDWADEIRDLGNEAAHEQSSIDKTQLKMIRGFTDTLSRYLYTLPAEVNARRKIP